MRAVLYLLLAVQASEGVAEVEECEDHDDVCLLQNMHFMSRTAMHGEATTECPGAPVVVDAQSGLCSYTGVSITVKDGRSITDFFDDNVQMKDFHFYLGNDKDLRITPESHPFPVGAPTKVTVVGRDLAGNLRECHRTVTVNDKQRPKWEKDPESVDKEITTYVDDTCQKTATAVFAEYEAMGWVANGNDNCAVDAVQRQVKQGGDVVYDDAGEQSDVLAKPGTYELVYTLPDASGNTVRHTVVVHLEDNSPPGKIEGCPADVFVEIEANATHGAADWALPKITADNCLGVVEPLPVPEEVNGWGAEKGNATGERTGKFPVGNTPLAYPLKDGSGNLYEEECTFTVEVKQKAHPVVITCPPDVTVNTIPMAGFAAPTWDAPTAKQGEADLPESQISYLKGAAPALPFPYGETSVTVRAEGLVTGTRTHEEEQFDECTFKVTVNDPQRPDVDGRHYRCAEEGAGVEPYGVCEGTNLIVTLHEGYETTGGYDLQEAVTASGHCCADEHGANYTCGGSAYSPKFKFCLPAR